MNCRLNNSKLIPLFSLGNLYISDFIDNNKGTRSPLNICIGETSGLVQLDRTINFDDLYRDYWYRSETNISMVKQLKDVVDSVLDNKSNIKNWVDIGSNDNTTLKMLPKEMLAKEGRCKYLRWAA